MKAEQIAEQIINSKISRRKITKYYSIAIYSYLLPLGFFGLFLLDSFTFGLTQMFFFAIALLSLLPVGVAGLIFTGKGLRISFKSNDYEKKDIGYANLIMGIIIFVAGLLGLGLGYIMVKN